MMPGKKPDGSRQKRGVNRRARPPWGRCQRQAPAKSTDVPGREVDVRRHPPFSLQPPREGPAPAAVASSSPQRRRTQQSRRRSLSLGAEHPLRASVYPGGAVTSRLLIAFNEQGAGVHSCCACCTRLPAPRRRASRSPSPLRRARRLAAALQTSGRFWTRGFPCCGLPCQRSG